MVSWEDPWFRKENPWFKYPLKPLEPSQVQQKVLNAEGKEVLRDVAFELNDLNDGKTEVQMPGKGQG